MTTTGVFAEETGEPIDFPKMRQERLGRALASMRRHDLEALLLAKPANVKYVTGTRSLWTAGRRPFSPSAIVLRDAGEVYMMTLWDEGVPKEIPEERLFPMSWNPADLMQHVTRILGGQATGRIGVDQMSYFFAGMLAKTFPSASVVDGTQAMAEARVVKTREEIECLRLSIAIAEASLSTAIAALTPGTTERRLLGAFMKKATGFGATKTVVQGGFCVQAPRRDPNEPTWLAGRPPLRQLSSDRPVNTGELVTMTSGVLYAGYESDVGRTWLCGPARSTARQEALYKRWNEVYEAMLTECRVGRTAADLRNAASRVSPLPPTPVAHGAGLGYEPPIAGSELGAEAEAAMNLEPGMVLVLQPYVWEEDVGGYWAKETVLVTESAPQRLTTLSHGPLA